VPAIVSICKGSESLVGDLDTEGCAEGVRIGAADGD
jgi:hypothetical protein